MHRIWVVLSLLPLIATGCAVNKQVTISAKPADAVIKIDGVDRGRGPITENFVFNKETDIKRVTVGRLGFKEQVVNVTRDYERDTLVVELKPERKRVTFNVTPVPAVVSVDGRPVGADRVSSTSAELEFTVDARNQWTTHTASADRPGFLPSQAIVTWQGPEVINLRLEPMRKNVRIETVPTGAQVFVDGEAVGNSPVVLTERAFPYDVDANAFVPQTVKVVKPGFDPIEQTVSWDEGRTDYTIDLQAKSKMVKITTDPPGGVVTIDGKELPRDSSGATSVRLVFPPVNETGELKTYMATVLKKTDSSEWYPANLNIGWDGGKEEYSVNLKEILTTQVLLLKAQMVRGDEGWLATPQRVPTVAAKDTTETSTPDPVVQVTRLPRGSQVDTLTLSPDGSKLLFTILATGREPTDFRSQLVFVKTDGSGGMDFLSDGKSLDLTPSFSPGGDTIVFSSNRAGRRLSVWSMSALGAPGVTNLTSGETNDLWPNLDSDPKPRLFYQALIDTRPDARIFSTQLGTVSRTDLTPQAGMQPRINPKNDTILFCAVNEKTGKRDLYRMTDRGGSAENLTNSPDVDEFDAVWNKDGSRIAFVSDRGVDQDKRNNLDIWVMDLNRPDAPTQITTNASHDDCPVWDPSGTTIYFRSNRGGEWNIWKASAR